MHFLLEKNHKICLYNGFAIGYIIISLVTLSSEDLHWVI